MSFKNSCEAEFSARIGTHIAACELARAFKLSRSRLQSSLSMKGEAMKGANSLGEGREMPRIKPSTPTVTRPIATLFCTSLVIGIIGCSNPPHKFSFVDDLQGLQTTSQQKCSGHIVLQKEADDLRENPGRIGNWTATLFAIETRSVEPTSPLSIEVVMQVKKALESTGYQITLADAPSSILHPGPFLKIYIKEFYFRNYSWLLPLVRTWGDIALRLALENHEGTVLFDETFQQSGSSYRLFEGGFNQAIEEALTKVLNQIADASCTEEFRHALKVNPAI